MLLIGFHEIHSSHRCSRPSLNCFPYRKINRALVNYNRPLNCGLERHHKRFRNVKIRLAVCWELKHILHKSEPCVDLIMVYVQSLIIVLLVTQTCIAAALAGDQAISREAAAVIGEKHSERHTTKDAGMTPVTPLDRVAAAVDGAESSHGKDLAV